ncbi:MULTISPECIES: hypothetical protein [unclassified Nonomuraea]|uniref:hypothetical protein n=1 Tax=unclassified Nonomuraea TaxID=2593643 RepID=UPI0033DB0017
MSQRRSGLLSGLVVGFVAMVIGAAGYAAALFFGSSLPFDVRWLGDGLALPAAASFAVGVFGGLAVRAVRGRSLVLPVVSVVYACGALVLGFVAFLTAGAIKNGMPVENVDKVLAYAQAGVLILWRFLQTSWAFWLMGGVAALPAFLLPLARALRLRRADRRADRADAMPAQEPLPEEQPEPEYRAPFEPLQPPKATPTATTANLFAPRDPVQD